jgi:dTDP-4-dehydrorhamnose reductase
MNKKTAPKKILVTGGSGMLGAACCYAYSKKYKTYFSYNSNAIQIKGCEGFKAELSDSKQVENLFQKIKPDIVIHTAAQTNLELCEEKPEIAERDNVTATANVAEQCRKHGALLIHISTNYVFDGAKGNYKETDKPNPISIYAETKARAENEVTKRLKDYFIVRTSIFGWNIVSSRVNSVTWLLRDLGQGKKIRAIKDQYSSMMLANDLADKLELLFDFSANEKYGIYNIATKDKVDRLSLANKVAKLYNLDSGLIEPITFAEFEKLGYWKAKRPKDSSLDCSKFEKEFKTKLPTVDQCLKRFKGLEDNDYLKQFKMGK